VRYQAVFRTALFAPVVTTLVAVAIVWRYLYHPRFGLFNAFLGSLGLPPIDWLGEPRFAMPAIVLLAAWRSFGYGLVILVAGLQGIPSALYEAAALDGASGWQQFRRITLPMLRPTLLFVATLTVVGFFQVFAEPYVMTRGGPANATLTIVLLMYQQGFRWWNMGRASAIAFALFALILLTTAVQRAYERRRAS
jgi:multiple sugar transport system permease protein